ncbi:uncharacterized protein LOC135195339 [Macrobrachium nipponense]|uniref:uncharacterized protein LOC135195339 n=1 Tax=Macrobrachium nipponense TaxID=159736 RepID=UPI0030C8603A
MQWCGPVGGATSKWECRIGEVALALSARSFQRTGVTLGRILIAVIQQDGAPPHYALKVRDYLNQASMALRSPGLTPMDFFLYFGDYRRLDSKMKPTLDMFLLLNRRHGACEEIRNEELWELLYADDLVITAENEEDLQRGVGEWEESLEGVGLKVNVNKTGFAEQ